MFVGSLCVCVCVLALVFFSRVWDSFHALLRVFPLCAHSERVCAFHQSCTHTHICVHISAYKLIHRAIQPYTHAHVRIRTHLVTRAHTHTHVHKRIGCWSNALSTSIYTLIHTHVHTQCTYALVCTHTHVVHANAYSHTLGGLAVYKHVYVPPTYGQGFGVFLFHSRRVYVYVGLPHKVCVCAHMWFCMYLFVNVLLCAYTCLCMWVRVCVCVYVFAHA